MPSNRITRLALLFEGGLGAAALGVGWLVGHQPAIGMSWSLSDVPQQAVAVGWGVAATLPLLVGLVLIDRFPVGPLRRLRQAAYQDVAPLFAGASVVQLAAIAVAAGLGEELLFRGLLQAGLSRLLPGGWGPWAALAIASAVFGVCHWLSGTYALLAALAGAWFGLLLLVSGSLWPPIVAHALYDFVALIYLVRPNQWLWPSVQPIAPDTAPDS